MSHFAHYMGIDYSGAETADSSCKGIRVFMADGSAEPSQVQPPPSPRRYWTRRGLAEWLCNKLGDDTPTIVGIDYAFSFPLAYFEKYRLSGNWEDFLVDFQYHWPTDDRNTYVSFIRDDPSRGSKRKGERSWFRVTDAALTFEEVIMQVAKEFKLTIVDDSIEKKLEYAKALPLTSTPEQELQLAKELGLT